ncbi:hypothetical protein ABCW44_00920 [Mannheimia haemolytica]|uniref:hypothetical protein n=1 Tax=Mannheimia haemolytica TaxID=75985 RepID=UPI0032096B8D
MTKFFETIALVMLFGIIPSCLLAINTTLMNIKNAPWFMVIIQLGFWILISFVIGCGLFLLCGMLFKEINKWASAMN